MPSWSPAAASWRSSGDEINNRRARNVDFGVDTLHDTKSVSKSVASLALGIAIVGHFQGRPAGDLASGLNRKRRRAALQWSAQDTSHHFAAPRVLSLSG
jgi:hypothetical protein